MAGCMAHGMPVCIATHPIRMCFTTLPVDVCSQTLRGALRALYGGIVRPTMPPGVVPPHSTSHAGHTKRRLYTTAF